MHAKNLQWHECMNYYMCESVIEVIRATHLFKVKHMLKRVLGGWEPRCSAVQLPVIADHCARFACKTQALLENKAIHVSLGFSIGRTYSHINYKKSVQFINYQTLPIMHWY